MSEPDTSRVETFWEYCARCKRERTHVCNHPSEFHSAIGGCYSPTCLDCGHSTEDDVPDRILGDDKRARFDGSTTILYGSLRVEPGEIVAYRGKVLRVYGDLVIEPGGRLMAIGDPV